MSDTIITVCLGMNDVSEDPTLGITCAGSRLAIDILEEGTVRTSPKLTRLLVREALALLRSPAEDATERLADGYDESFRASFENALHDVSQSDVADRSSVWALLLALVRRGVPWAIALADQNWPPDKAVLRRMIRQGLYAEHRVTSWWLEKLKLALPSLRPGDVVPIRRILAKHARKDVPKWLLDAAEFPYLGSRNSLQFLVLGDQSQIARGSHKIATIPIKPKERWPLDFTEMPDPGSEWSQMIVAAQFVKKPSARSLAEALNTIATLADGQGEALRWTSWPWPLGAILAFASNNEAIRNCADIATEGGFGDLPDWLAAEERWLKDGVRELDFLYCCGRDVPFDLDIARIGLPHGAIHPIDRRNDPEVELLRIFEKMPSGRHKGLLAQSILMHLIPMRDHLDLTVYPNEILRQAIRESDEDYFYLDVLSVAENLRSLLIENAVMFGNLVLRKEIYVGPRAMGHRERPFLAAMQESFCSVFRERPEFTWLICLIASTALRGVQFDIGRPLQSIDLSGLCEKEKASAVVLMIIEGAWSNEKVSVFEERAVRDEFHRLTFIFRELFDLVPAHCLPIVERLLHRIYEVLDPDEEGLRRSVGMALGDLVSRRRSNLLEVGEWDALGLPPSLQSVGRL